jgi:hypothetical protein
MAVAPCASGGRLGISWRNRIVRPASLRHSDAAVGFISTQSPDAAVAVPTRVLRAEKNLVRADRAEFTLARSSRDQPGGAWAFSPGEERFLEPNKGTSRSSMRRDALAEARRPEDSAERHSVIHVSGVKRLAACRGAPCWRPRCGLVAVLLHRLSRRASWRTTRAAAGGPWPRWPWAGRFA